MAFFQKLKTRLSTWRELARTKPEVEDEAVIAGRRGENFLQDFVDNHLEFGDAHLFPAKRVPKSGGGKKEIDLIVVTYKQIHIIEAKNWSGQLREREAGWVQIRRSGQEVEHPNLVRYNRQKMEILRQYLQSKGLELPEEYFTQKVVFINPRLEVDSALENNSHVITMDKLSGYFNEHQRRGPAEKMFCSVIEFCLSAEAAEKVVSDLYGKLSGGQFDRLLDALDELSTWDQLHYYGDRIATGDLIRIETAAETLRREDIEKNHLRVSWTRNRVIAFFQALFFLGNLGRLVLAGQRDLPLVKGDEVYFHFVGRPEPEGVSLVKLEEIYLGRGGTRHRRWRKRLLGSLFVLLFASAVAGALYWYFG